MNGRRRGRGREARGLRPGRGARPPRGRRSRESTPDRLTSGRAAEGLNDFRPVPAQGEDKARILALIQADSPEPVAETMWFPARR